MTSYHEAIQTKAREIEADRAKTYSQQGSGGRKIPIRFSEFQMLCLYGALYKILRVKTETTVRAKVKDDILDAYNYLALFYQDFEKEDSGETKA